MTKPITPPSKTTRPTGKAATGAQGTSATTSPARASGRYQPGRDRRVRMKGSAEYGRRVKKPIIFNVGRDLPAAQRTRLQKKLYFTFAGVMAALVVLVFAFGWFNINVIQPNMAIVTVNGANIPQKNYRYMVAYLAQDTWNKLQAANAQVTQLTSQIASEKDSTKKAALQTQLQSAQTTVSSLQTSFSQTQIDQLAIDDLVEDQLIQQQTPQYLHSDPNAAKTLTITSAQLNQAFQDFKKAFPAGQSLSNFEKQNNMSDDNVKFALGVVLRRKAMDTYQQSLVVSPAYAVHFQRIEFDGLSQAKADLAILQKDPSQWNALAKKDSLDVNTRDNGGDMGWNIQGQQDQGLEQWLFNRNNKAGTMSGVLKEVSGTYDIVRIIAVDPNHTIDSTTLQNLKQNALSHWLTGLRNLPPTNHITTANQDMMTSPANVPQTPNLNITFPSSSGQIPGTTNP